MDFLNDIFGTNTQGNSGNKKKRRTPIPQGKVKHLMIRAKGHCEKCGVDLKGLNPYIHHKNQDPSENKMSNLIVLCPNCHRKAHYNKDGTITKTRRNSTKSSSDNNKSIGAIDFDILGSNSKKGRKRKDDDRFGGFL